MTSHWLEADQRYIPAHQQPALLIDIAKSRGIALDRLLSHTGIFYDDVLCGALDISPEQYLRLIQNAEKLLKSDDLSFLFGHRFFPGNYGPLTEAMIQSENLLQALELICQYNTHALPLMNIQMHLDDNYCHLNFFDCTRAGNQGRFLIETTAAAISQMSRWLSGKHLPWQFYFSYSKPVYQEQYLVHVSGEHIFDSHSDAMVLPKEHLLAPFNRGNITACAVARRQCETHFGDSALPFLSSVYRYLYQEARRSPSLIRTAEHFGMSPATFKRKLKKHRCSFQVIQDCVRKQVAVYLFTHCGYTNELVAHHLNFADVNNFRRSFKRWTGLNPSLFKQS